MKRSMMDTIRVRIPAGRGTVMTMASDTNMAVHTRPESRGSRTAEPHKQHQINIC